MRKRAKEYVSKLYDWEQENRYVWPSRYNEYKEKREKFVEENIKPVKRLNDNQEFVDRLAKWFILSDVGLDIVHVVERTAKDVDASWKEW